MVITARMRPGRAASVLLFALSASLLASCAAQTPKGMVSKTQRSKEYFSEKDYGVKASPRVSSGKGNFKRGGGRDQIGKPYMVRGKMYYPKEEKNYRKVGAASWYGDAFHGRLTANGEIYDMTHLTAAHPTMPLPSYARVTNLATGSSVVVRVNDRGPYAAGRVIDLSRKAADMLDYASAGTAKVQVEYIGRAPLEGHDDQYLLASYRPGKGEGSDPASDGLPTGVMIAMNGATPSGAVPGIATAFPGQLTQTGATGVQQDPVITSNVAPSPTMVASGDLDLPDFGPIAPERPDIELVRNTQVAMATMSYASDRTAGASAALDALTISGAAPEGLAGSWKRGKATSPAADAGTLPFVAAGSFEDRDAAQKLDAALSPFGRVVVDVSQNAGKSIYSVDVFEDGRGSIDSLLEAAWSHGAPDAIVVRD